MIALPHVRFDGVSKSFGATLALAPLDLGVRPGEFTVLIGPSGCGKTTSLRLLAGFEPPSTGRLFLGQRDITAVAPRDRNMAMVFQNYALYPHMTAAENMGFALRLQGLKPAEIDIRVRRAADMLGLGPLLARRPRELSGGQRQRVAVGRAIVRDPEVFLFDEPLSNLDAKLRASARGEIRALQRQLGVTTVYVTHDQVEAMSMADRIAVMHQGRLLQYAAPLEVYDRPADITVASFLGSPPMNILPAATFYQTAAAPEAVLAWAAGMTSIGIRPERLALSPPSDGAISLAARLTQIENLGAETLLSTVVGGDTPVLLRLPGTVALADHAALTLFAPVQHLVGFGADGRRVDLGGG